MILFESYLGNVGFKGVAMVKGHFKHDPVHIEDDWGYGAFDYSNNNGVIIIGLDEWLFNLKFSTASDQTIHVYSDEENIDSLALAKGESEFTKLRRSPHYDFSSRCVCLKIGEIVIFCNIHQNYAAVRILEIKDQSRSDDCDWVKFSYEINSEGEINFSRNL